MRKVVSLGEATRTELIRELFMRDSITAIQINKGEAAKIETKYGNVSVVGESNIFVITPLDTDKFRLNLMDRVRISGKNVTFDKKENITTANSDDDDLASMISNALNKNIHQNLDPSKHSLVITSNGKNVRVFTNGVEYQGLREVDFKFNIKEGAELKLAQIILPNGNVQLKDLDLKIVANINNESFINHLNETLK